MNPLDGARAKLGWANKHFETLKADISRLPDEAKNVRISQQFEPNEGRIQLIISSVPNYPTEWSLLIGDAVQNFRAALNYLAWELAKWNLAKQGLSRDPDGGTQYPIATQPQHFQRHYVKDIHPNHIALMEHLQPYRPGAMERTETQYVQPYKWYLEWAPTINHPLGRLQTLSNADKHQSLRPIAIRHAVGSLRPEAYRGIDCEITSVAMFATDIFKIGAVWANIVVRPTGNNPQVEMNDHFTPEIAFENFWSLEETLSKISTEVAFIIGKFETVFVP